MDSGEMAGAAAVKASSGNPFLEGLHTPLKAELSVDSLEVIGAMPAQLDGFYMRNGPNPIAADPGNYHWFSGDGMVHAVRIKDGKAHWYKNRWIRSQRAAAALGEAPASGPRHSPSDVVNTNVTRLGRKIHALVEAGSTPVALSESLDEQAYSDFGGTLQGAFSAHPHLDPDTGEHHAITYHPRASLNLVHHVVVNAEGRVIREEPVPVEHGPSTHDCAFTARYALVLDLPVTFSMTAAMAGASFPFRWNPQHKPRIGLLPRHGGADEIIWCEAPSAYIFHVLNAYDDADGRVIMDCVAYDQVFEGDPQGVNTPPRGLERWSIDPQRKLVTVETLDASPQEFPRPDERYFGKKHRYGFTMGLPARVGEQSQAGNGLYKHDLQARTRQFHDFGEGRYPGEFVFTPRRADAPEGDGWLMGLVIDERAARSELVVIDATAFEAPPVARVILPHLIPPGFHGNWIESLSV